MQFPHARLHGACIPSVASAASKDMATIVTRSITAMLLVLGVGTRGCVEVCSVGGGGDEPLTLQQRLLNSPADRS